MNIHYRYMASGRAQLTPPVGHFGVDRSTFDIARPNLAGALAVVGAIKLGMPLSIWASADTDEARAAAKAELEAKLVIIKAMTGWNGNK